MKQRLIIGTAIALCAALCVWLFVEFFEPVPRKVWVGYRGEAAKHRFLAAERFLDAHGIAIVRARNVGTPGALEPHAVAILSAGRQALTSNHVDRLFAWVQSGNHLIVAPEPEAHDDAILDRLRIRRGVVPAPRTDSRSKNDEERNEATHSSDASGPSRSPHHGESDQATRGCGVNEHIDEVVIPGIADKLNVEFGRQPNLMLDPNQMEHIWSGRAGIQMASLRVGSGRVTVTPIGMFTNTRIGQFDHAALLHALVSWERGVVSATFFDRMDSLSLMQWIIDNALWVACGAFLLTLLWLWRVMVRFGPIAPDPSMARRSLIDHLAAAGRFQWRAGDRDGLVAAARDHAMAHAARVIPGFALLSATEQRNRLAAIALLSADEARRALAGQARTSSEFIALTKVLRRIYAAGGRAVRATDRTAADRPAQ